METRITKAQIENIVFNCFTSIDSIENQNSDRLDFHDVAIWEIKEAIETAYRLGYQQAQKDNKI
jgi:hypothetical protein